MRSYTIEGKHLEDITFKDAQQISSDCEQHFFETGQRLGGWAPTREMLYGHIRLEADERYRVRAHIRILWLCIGIEALLILALIALHLLR